MCKSVLLCLSLLIAALSAQSQSAKAGDPAPNAKFLDADQLYSFNAGSALIRKGTSSALIDAHGNFVAPFNTYNLTGIFVAGPVGYEVRYNGMYTFNNVNANWGGYINSKGKVIFRTGITPHVIDFTDNKQLLFINNSTSQAISYTYITPDGAAYSVPALIEHIVDGIGIARPKPSVPEYFYRKLTGEIIAGPFEEAEPFSDGMARVGKEDQFGIIKYGFINAQGKLVIPCSFSIPPTGFSGGFARVQPKDQSDFEYAFINKSGDVVFKQSLNDIRKNGKFDHFTNFGLAFSDKAILDVTFKIIPKAAFFQSFGIPADSWFMEDGVYTIGESNPKLVYSTRTARSPYTQMPLYGFINLSTKKVVAPVFEFSSTNGLWFDPISHLAHAKVCIGRDKNNVPVYREGYIDEEGLFVLLKAEGSKW